MVRGVFGAYGVIHGLGTEGAVNHYWLAAKRSFDCLQKLCQPLEVCQLSSVWRVVQAAVVGVR